MKIAAQWVLLLAAVGLIMFGLIHYSPDEKKAATPKTLGDRVEAACKPYLVSDWHVDYMDPSLLMVDCYDPKTTNIRSTVVER